jgi:hypothetical protein
VNDDELRAELDALRQRIDRLEQLTGVAHWQIAPGFDPVKFQRIFVGYIAWLFLVLFAPMVLLALVTTAFQGQVAQEMLFGLPLWNIGGPPTMLGLPVGIISVGGGALGVIAVGGLGVGVIAYGGGAIGVLAIGGGAVGIVAVGGGAFGLLLGIGGGATGHIAIGGGAFGTYVLAGDGKGKHVFDRRRQDEEAVVFFCRYLPRLRQAFTDQAEEIH